MRERGWDATRIPWEQHGAVLRGELVPDLSARIQPVVSETTNTWTPIDLVALAASPPEPATISGLVYPGRRHVFSGEPETLKTWAAQVMCVEQIVAGHEIVWIDFEMDGREHAARLRALGLADEQLSSFFYVHPSEPLPPVLAAFEALISVVQPTLVVFDAFTGALALHGADENKNTEVERFYTSVVSPIQAQGAAVVLLDHVTKNPETRGRYSIGGGRKLGACDVHLGFEIVKAFGRGKTGIAKVLAHKDRPGYLTRPKAAELELVSDAETGSVTPRWHAGSEGEGVPQSFRPTWIMEKVSQYVGSKPVEDLPSRTQIEENVGGRREYIRQAIDRLIVEEFLAIEQGPRGASVLRFVRPFSRAIDESKEAA